MKQADLILYNGRVHTMEPGQPTQQAVAVMGNRIAAVGDDAGIWLWKGSDTELIDLKGRALIPGLVDGHVHFGSYARALYRIDLAEVDSLQEVVRRVAARAAGTPSGEWLLGWGWNHNLWKEGRFPRKEDVDAVSGDHPMSLRSKDGHVVWVNREALRLAGIGPHTPNPAGGEIERDPRTGEATGILKENAQELIAKLIPETAVDTLQQMLKEAFAKAHSFGLTGVHNREGAIELSAFQELLKRGEMGLRIYGSIPMEDLEAAIALGIRSGMGNEWLRMGGVKIFCDGALGSRTADMLEPYDSDLHNRGIEVTGSEELSRLIGRAARAGIHANIHAIGDRANRRALDALDVSIRVGEGAGLRHSIEHVQVVHPDDLPRLGKLSIIASMQPIHCTSDMKMADLHWGKRARYSYAWRSLLDSGAKLSFGSDCPVESLNPLYGIYAAVTRQRQNGAPSGGWYPKERLSINEAVRGFTLGPAYASGEEKIKGSIAPGKLADLVALSQDIFALSPTEILHTQADYTILDGRIVYARR
jgi:predicted amidohydrolase YtcJ